MKEKERENIYIYIYLTNYNLQEHKTRKMLIENHVMTAAYYYYYYFSVYIYICEFDEKRNLQVNVIILDVSALERLLV